MMSHISEHPTEVSLADGRRPVSHHPPTELRKVGNVIIPSKTWVPFLAGAIGGMAGAVLTAPLDVVKTRLQSDFYRERVMAANAAAPAASRFGAWRHLKETVLIIRSQDPVFYGMCLGLMNRDVYRFEGLRALFKGLGPTLSGVVPAR